MSEEKYILGLNYLGHDASASLLKGSKIIASVMEERFSRVKHDRNFPKQAIKFCLKTAGIDITQIDTVTYYLIPEVHFQERVVNHLVRYPEATPLFPGALDRALKVNNVKIEVREKLAQIQEEINLEKGVRKGVSQKEEYLNEIYFCDHHMGHIALSFFPSPFESAAAISVDGLGEITSTVIADCNGTEIKVLKKFDFPQSLGMLYNAVTHYCGFNAISDAGKVMGLAAYGDSAKHIDAFREIVKLTDDGGYEMDMSYFAYQHKPSVWISEKFIERFGEKRDVNTGSEVPEQKYKDIAAAMQQRLEEVFVHLAEYAKKVTGREYLVLSGGVALNSVANGVVLQKEIFRDMWIPPPCGDDGLSIGCPLFYHHCVLNNAQRTQIISPYLGPEYSDAEIERTLKKFNLPYTKSQDVCKEVAQLLSENKIVGWFQGRMEVGPRALGNRSILANAAVQDVKEQLNSRVKFREPFRPFAPSILREHVKDWFEYDHGAPYMLFVFNIKEDKQKLIPGVTHADGTGRLQTITQEMNPRYYELISQFHALTGVPIVVNTSFNIRGEPIVESPKDAVHCFLGNAIDVLALGDYVVKKEDFLSKK